MNSEKNSSEIIFLSEEEINKSNFFELALYLQNLNIIDNYLNLVNKGGDNND